MIPRRGALAAAVDWDAVPEAWGVKPLGDLAEVVGGGTPSRDVPEYWAGGTIPWVTPTDVTGSTGVFMSETSEMITEAGLAGSSATLLPAGTVLLTSRATIGACRINTVSMATNQGFASLVPKDTADTLYLYYRTLALKHVLERLGAGTTFLEVSKKDIRRILIPLPPGEERWKIAAILRSVDEAIERTEAVIAALREVKRGMMQRDMRGIGGETQPTCLGDAPAPWRRVKGEDLFVLSSGGQYPESYRDPATADALFLKVDDLNHPDNAHEVTTASQGFARAENPHVKVLPVGTIIFAKRGAAIYKDRVRRLARPAALDPNLMAMQTKAGLDAGYFHEYLAYVGLSRLAEDAGLPQMNNKDLYPRWFAVPSLERQAEIVARLRAFRAAEERLIQEVQRLSTLKRGLMQQLLTGKVRVKV